MKELYMKKIEENIDLIEDDLVPEYDFDYTKAKRNPYYKGKRTFVEIDEEIIEVFQNPYEINKVLKAIIESLPKNSVAL